MKYIISSLFVVFSIVLLAGCAAVNAGGAAEETAAQENKIFGSDVIAGIKEQNYRKFSGSFSPELRKNAPEAAFKKLCADLTGKKDSVECWKLLDILERGGVYRTEVWKVTLARKSNGKTSSIDRLFYVTIANSGSGDAIIGFRFDTLF